MRMHDCGVFGYRGLTGMLLVKTYSKWLVHC